jgi:hypothetical protein
MPSRFAALCAAGIIAFAGASCDAENENDVTCAEADCTSSCESFGFPGGACEDGACVCDTSDTDPFEWDGGADADSDADTDSDTDTNVAEDSGAKRG